MKKKAKKPGVKARATIQREIHRLCAIVNNKRDCSEVARCQAYGAWFALKWAIGEASSPATYWRPKSKLSEEQVTR